MSDFTSKHTLNEFIERCKDNGWVTNEKEEKFFNYFYNLSNDHDGIADDELNEIFNEEFHGWSSQNRMTDFSRLNSKLMSFAMNGTVPIDEIEEFMDITMSGPSQNELDSIKEERERNKAMNKPQSIFNEDILDNSYVQPTTNYVEYKNVENLDDDSNYDVEKLDDDGSVHNYNDDSGFLDIKDIRGQNDNDNNEIDPEKIENTQNAYNKIADLAELKNLILADLSEMKAQLSLTQDNPAANFVEGEKPEGSPEYQNMVKQINQGIQQLSKDDIKIKDIQQVLKDITKNSMIYSHEKTKGVLGGPKTENGINRLGISNDCAFRMGKYQDSISNIVSELTDHSQEDFGIDYNAVMNFNISDMRDYAQNYAEINGIELNDPTAQAVKNAESIRLENDKALLTSKIENLTGVYNGLLSEYTENKPKNMEEAAKMYITKKYMHDMKKGNVTSEKIREMQSSLSGKNLEKTVKNLSTNKIFKDAVKNSDNFYNSYYNIEKDAAELKYGAENMLETVKKQYGSEKEYVKNVELLEGMNLPYSNALGKNLADLYINKLLADPKNDKLRITLASSDDLEKRFKEHVEKHFTSRIIAESFKNKTALQGEGKKAMDNIIDGILNDRNNGKKILNSFANAEKAHAQKQEMYKEYNKVMQGGGPKL